MSIINDFVTLYREEAHESPNECNGPGANGHQAAIARRASPIDYINAHNVAYRLYEQVRAVWVRESLPKAERRWLGANRSPLARHWNLLTALTAEQLLYAR